MHNILISSSFAFIISYFSIPLIIEVAKVKKLFDEPDERKIHTTVIPTLGGLGIFAGFILALLLGSPTGFFELQYFVAASIVIFFLGVKDDIVILSPVKKFIGQLFAAFIIIKFGGVQITNLHGFLGITQLPELISIIFTVFTVVVIINSFNLIDGVDGLAGTLGLLTSIVFGTYFAIESQFTYAVMAFALGGSILAFLCYNFSPAKIFMGDTGSLLIGLINSILVIKFINIAGSSENQIPLQSVPALGFSILIVPLFDTLRVFGLRIFKRRSPFSPDRTHVHHFLLDLGFNHKAITLLCLGVNISFIGIAYSLRNLGTTQVIGILLILSFSIMGFIYYKRTKVSLYKNISKPKLKEKFPQSQLPIISNSLVAERVEFD